MVIVSVMFSFAKKEKKKIAMIFELYHGSNEMVFDVQRIKILKW